MAGLVLSDRDAKRLQTMLRRFEHGGRQPHHRGRGGGSGGVQIRIFEVQSAATGDGVYNCYRQILDATEWNDTAGDDKFDDKNTEEVEVFNLLESNPEATYSPALAKYDLIAAWQESDDEGNNRYEGIPCVNSCRQARTTQAAPADTKITANLYSRAGIEITGADLGAGINVYCNITGSANLNSALPYLADAQDISVYNQQGKWWCNTVFHKMDICS